MEFVKNPNCHLGFPKIDRLVQCATDSARHTAGLINGNLDHKGYGSVFVDEWERAKEEKKPISGPSPPPLTPHGFSIPRSHA